MEQKQITYNELLRFFLPIAAMSMIMMSSHNVISWSLSQMTAPALALTAYSVGQSVSSMLMAPIWALVKLTTSSATNRVSAENLMKLAWQVALIVGILMLAIGFTPLGRIVFVDIMGVSEDLLTETLWSFRIFLAMPVIGIYRSSHQGFVVLRRKTIWLTFGTIMRIGSMFLMALIFTQSRIVDGGVVGSMILMTGFTVEGIITFINGRPWLKEVPEEATAIAPVQTVSQLWVFFIPLIIAQFINTFVNPGISAGLARTEDPELAISAYYVARSLAWIFLSLGFRIHQLVLVYVRDVPSWLKVRRFVGMISAVMTGAVALLALTPAGAWVYANIIHIEPGIAGEALKSLVYFIPIPFAMFYAELYQGVMLLERRSREITICKTVNVGVLFAVLFTMVAVAPQYGSVIGAISLMISFLAEAAVAYLLARKAVVFSRRAI